MRNSLLAAFAAQRPPEITGLGDGAGWKFETMALAADFRHFETRAGDADRKPTLSIFDYIGDDGDGGGVSAKRVAGALRALAGQDIVVEINSPGGNYFDGVAIYNLLRRHDGNVEVQILGQAASAASVIAMAGDTISMAHNSEIMIHEARGLFFGTKSEMAGAMAVLGHIDDSMVETYAARSGRPAADFSAMIAGKDVYFRGEEAIEAGLADTLMEREAQMPVYASADDLPTDKASLDKFLAKHAVAVTCKACGKSRLYDLEELIKARLFQRKSIDWGVVIREMPCWRCDAPTETHVAIVPYAANDRELRARRAEMLLMNLALKVLHSAAYGARRDDIDTPAVRLALRVLRPFLPDRSLLVRFWDEGKAAKGQALSDAVHAHNWIVQALVKQGYSVWAEFRLG